MTVLENMHHFVEDVSQLNLSSLGVFVERARGLYRENMTVYVKMLLRRSFGRMMVSRLVTHHLWFRPLTYPSLGLLRRCRETTLYDTRFRSPPAQCLLPLQPQKDIERLRRQGHAESHRDNDPTCGQALWRGRRGPKFGPELG